MPAFSTSSVLNGLIEAMRGLGIERLFNEREALTAMFENSGATTEMGLLRQCATIKVDEEGAVAGATTVGSQGVISPGPMEGDEFKLNRPFLYFICEQSTGIVIFSGAVRQL